MTLGLWQTPDNQTSDQTGTRAPVRQSSARSSPEHPDEPVRTVLKPTPGPGSTTSWSTEGPLKSPKRPFELLRATVLDNRPAERDGPLFAPSSTPVLGIGITIPGSRREASKTPRRPVGRCSRESSGSSRTPTQQLAHSFKEPLTGLVEGAVSTRPSLFSRLSEETGTLTCRPDLEVGTRRRVLWVCEGPSQPSQRHKRPHKRAFLGDGNAVA